MNGISKSKRRLALRLRSRRGREREGLALAEGPRVVVEALRSSVEVRWVAVGGELAARQEGRAIAEAAHRRGAQVLIADGAAVRDLCSTESPLPVLACVRPPSRDTRPLVRGRYLMAAGVQIPGNLGTLIRSAWGFGLDGVVIGKGTVDPWNAKVVRASAGGLFHVPLIAPPGGGAGEAGGVVATEGAEAVNFLHADPAGAPLDRVEAAHRRNWVLVVGNEVGGAPRPEGEAARISVPLAPGVDSLNVAVAGSILMHLLTGGTPREEE
ncbi:MAG: RNA methyltransferase [Gemmatimonadetes bacterium]|nr:RNA methyltransferase [Gemmatimonadota bacterium]MCY3677046.1 RNA methyltransferase [Gemmatimonadota bacterium]MYA40425.1 RNA methyltransferase [Gemmatimonadota bacterium]MYJ09494.1 RNA methyltransferase [Gemmatimonadota bacterium]